MEWEPAQRVQKNDAGQFRAFIGNEWVPVERAQKSETGEFRVMRAAPVAPAAPEQPVGEIPSGRKTYQAPTMAESIMGTPAMRFALGAATPVVGAFQLGANVGDVISEKLGYTPTVGKSVADWWNNVQAMKKKGMETPEQIMYGAANPDIAGMVGEVGTGIAGLGKSAATTVGKKVLEGAKLGAIFGAAQPGAENIQSNVIGGAGGAVLGAAAPVVIPAAAKAAGWAWDAAKGNLVQMKAGKVLREIAGSNLDDINKALATAKPDRTAAQAVQEAGVIDPVFQAMGERGRKLSPELASASAQRAAAERAAREESIVNVTPDLKKALDARTLASEPLYEAAKKQVIKIDAPLMDLFERMPKGTVEAAANIARMEGRPFQMGAYVPAHTVETGILDAAGKPIVQQVPEQLPKITGDSLHYLKRALSDISNASPATGVGKDTQQAARGVLNEFLQQVETKIPKYGQARETFAAKSEPVNQAQVLNEMLSVLQKPGGAGERAAPFLNVLGRGEQSMLKRSTGVPRYEGVADVLSQPQMAAVRDVAGQLERNAQMAELAGKGEAALSKLLKEDTSPVTSPSWFNWVTTALNKVSSNLQGRVNEKTLKTIAEAMQSGKGAQDLLNTVPASERSVVLKAMIDSKAWDPAVLSTIGAATSNALAPKRQQNQNALAGK